MYSYIIYKYMFKGCVCLISQIFPSPSSRVSVKFYAGPHQSIIQPFCSTCWKKTHVEDGTSESDPNLRAKGLLASEIFSQKPRQGIPNLSEHSETSWNLLLWHPPHQNKHIDSALTLHWSGPGSKRHNHWTQGLSSWRDMSSDFLQ